MSDLAVSNRPSESLHLASLKNFSFDIRDQTNWTFKQTAFSGAVINPIRSKARDQMVIWATVYMDKATRAETFPADFETHGGIRTTRVPDPPMVFEASCSGSTAWMRL